MIEAYRPKRYSEIHWTDAGDNGHSRYGSRIRVQFAKDSAIAVLDGFSTVRSSSIVRSHLET